MRISGNIGFPLTTAISLGEISNTKNLTNTLTPLPTCSSGQNRSRLSGAANINGSSRNFIRPWRCFITVSFGPARNRKCWLAPSPARPVESRIFTSDFSRLTSPRRPRCAFLTACPIPRFSSPASAATPIGGPFRRRNSKWFATNRRRRSPPHSRHR